ncbi:MAG: response regulator [Magnetococcales bacterium]|nr:response regulator [Magnetococcales bacterium]
MSEKKRIFLLVMIMIMVAVVVGGLSIYTLYQSAFLAEIRSPFLHTCLVIFSICTSVILIGSFIFYGIITECQLAEERVAQAYRDLQAKEKLIDDILFHTNSVIFIKELDGRYRLINRQFEELFHIQNHEIQGKTDFEIFPKNVAEKFRENDIQVLESQHTLKIEETVPQDDGIHTYLSVKFALNDTDGKPYAICGIATDITERTMMEKSLLKAKETAEESTRAKDLFLANMSHEIRTPLNGILGMIELVLNTELEMKNREYLNHAKSASYVLLRVINDILDFSKIEAGKLAMESVNFYLGDVLADTISLFRLAAIEKDLELVVSAPPQSIGMLTGDRLRIQQVLVNLVGNAIKFTRTGEVVIKAIVIEQTETHVQIEFSVEDTGIGISAEQCSRLFAPFVQADSSITRQFGGTGLGLTICKRLVEMMGGKIWVESIPNVGSIFYATVILGRSSQDMPHQHLIPEDFHNLKTLVMDDNKNALCVTSAMLNNFGFAVTTAESGEACLEAWRFAIQQGSPFDLLLLDWRMPDMDGIEVTKKILYDPLVGVAQANRAKIILMTAFGKEAIIHDAKQLGVDGCLGKPLPPSLLLNTILDVFGKTANKVYDSQLAGVNKAEWMHTLGGARVLLVEDSPINQLVAQGMLQNVGMIVTLANHGQEALHLLMTRPFDLVFMDVQMPILDGFETTRRIRQMEKLSQLPIIAMTANVMTGDLERCLEAGMNDYITKPIDPRLFYAVLTKWLSLSLTPLTQPLELNATPHSQEDGLTDMAALTPLFHQAADLLSQYNLDVEIVIKEMEKLVKGNRDFNYMNTLKHLVHHYNFSEGLDLLRHWAITIGVELPIIDEQ